MSLNVKKFREALSAFATGVTVVTTKNSEGESVGMTASSFNSVSMSPPLILWSVSKNAKSAHAFKDAPYFSVNVLSSSQIEISNRFATSGANKFENTPHIINENNVPLISDCTSRFDCKKYAVHDGGDHWIVLGEVLTFEDSKREGLVFSSGSYATATLIK